MKPRPRPAARFDRPQLLIIAASTIGAAMIIHAGDIAGPLAVWVGTALVPLGLSRRRRGHQHSPIQWLADAPGRR